MNKKIFVLGGGTAGWLTALFLKKIFLNYSITVISNEKIGIVGVGEATTPNIIKFLNYLNIDFLDVIKNSEGSIKNGISFENWNNDGNKYFHGFSPKNDLLNFEIKNIFNYDVYDFFIKKLIDSNLDLNKYLYVNKISYQNKIDLNNIEFALHFDTHLLGKFLKKTANIRGVQHLEGTFKKVFVNEKGYINKILIDNITYDCDFVFDCSGFKREIIQNFYNEKWLSYSKYLPMKKAIPFYLKTNKKIEPYTKAISMKYGWMWKIPLQSRYGAGYVFDSDYINENQALEEVEKFLNTSVNIRNVIKFEAGRFEKTWIKNCIAIGLSATFIEPLESTSIFLTIAQLETLRHYLNDFFIEDENHKQMYNKIIANNMEDTLDFVRLHYVCKRKDTNFWKEFSKNKLTKRLEEILPVLKNNEISPHYFQYKLKTAYFGLRAHLYVGNGLGLIKSKGKESFYSKNLYPNLNEYVDIMNNYISSSKEHKEFLNSFAL